MRVLVQEPGRWAAEAESLVADGQKRPGDGFHEPIHFAGRGAGRKGQVTYTVKVKRKAE